MALTTLQVAAIPVLAGLAAWSGVVATSLLGTDTAPAAVNATQSERPCEAQTWPYIDRKCLTGSVAQEQRPVRVVVAPRDPEAIEGANAAGTPPRDLATRETVLRAPERAEPKPAAQPIPAVDARARRARRQEKFARRWTAQSYQVPAEHRGHGAMRPMIVIRPLRLGPLRLGAFR